LANTVPIKWEKKWEGPEIPQVRFSIPAFGRLLFFDDTINFFFIFFFFYLLLLAIFLSLAGLVEGCCAEEGCAVSVERQDDLALSHRWIGGSFELVRAV
jgi:hypothetical protein